MGLNLADPATLEIYRAVLVPVVTLLTSIVASGVVVSYVTEFLKSDYVPVKFFNRFPRLTVFLASLVATVVSVYLASFNIVFVSVYEYVGLVVGILLVAVISYKRLVKGVFPNSTPPAVDKTVTPNA